MFYSHSVQVLQARYALGSWNLLHLGWDNGKNLTAVAAVAAQFDLLAVQELMDPAALARLDRRLERYTGVEPSTESFEELTRGF